MGFLSMDCIGQNVAPLQYQQKIPGILSVFTPGTAGVDNSTNHAKLLRRSNLGEFRLVEGSKRLDRYHGLRANPAVFGRRRGPVPFYDDGIDIDCMASPGHD